MTRYRWQSIGEGKILRQLEGHREAVNAIEDDFPRCRTTSCGG